MGSDNKQYIQCTRCGIISELDKYNKRIPIEQTYLCSYCNECQRVSKHINLGDIKDDIYLYADINIDQRYL